MLQGYAWDFETGRAAIGSAAQSARGQRPSAASVCNPANAPCFRPVLYREGLAVSRIERANSQSSRGAPGLDLVPDHGRHVGAAEVLDRPDAGRRGDVDLGEVAVDHVDTDEEEPALAQRRPD